MENENQIDINLKFNCDESGIEAAKQELDSLNSKLVDESTALDSESNDHEAVSPLTPNESLASEHESEQSSYLSGLTDVFLAIIKSTSEFDKNIQALTEELRKSNAKAESLRQSAQDTRAKAGAMSGALEAAEIEGDTARRIAARGETAAQTALDKNHAEAAAKEARIADAEKASYILSVQKQDLKEKIAAEEQKKAAAAKAVYQAQGTMDAARLGGNRSAQQSALANLQAAQNAAQNVNFAADQAITALTTTLKNVEDKLNQVNHVIKSGRKQQQNFVSEAHAGE